MPKIIVSYRKNEDDHNAWYAENPSLQGFGSTKAEAIGELIRQDKNFEIVEWGSRPDFEDDEDEELED